jgi:hypothetical protein
MEILNLKTLKFKIRVKSNITRNRGIYLALNILFGLCELKYSKSIVESFLFIILLLINVQWLIQPIKTVQVFLTYQKHTASVIHLLNFSVMMKSVPVLKNSR